MTNGILIKTLFTMTGEFKRGVIREGAISESETSQTDVAPATGSHSAVGMEWQQLATVELGQLCSQRSLYIFQHLNIA